MKTLNNKIILKPIRKADASNIKIVGQNSKKYIGEIVENVNALYKKGRKVLYNGICAVEIKYQGDYVDVVDVRDILAMVED